MAIPRRKFPYSVPPVDDSNDDAAFEPEYVSRPHLRITGQRKPTDKPAEQRKARRTLSGSLKRRLVLIFGIGVVVIAAATATLALAVIIDSNSLRLVSSVLLAVGTVMAAMAILRGQQLDERGR